MRFVLIVVVLVYLSIPSQDLTSSNLPIFVINTMGQQIVNEPDILVKMGVIYNGPGQTNNVTDPHNNYKGYVNIEYRGHSSQDPDKKPYAVETADSNGNDLNVSLLEFPEEEDWILNNVYFDKTFIRNVLTFKIWREMGHTAVRTKMCEVVLNDKYQGVYVFMEKIKRDKNRVDIAKLKDSDTTGDQLTGGYILKLDWIEDENKIDDSLGFDSDYNTLGSKKLFFHYVYPKPRDIQSAQKRYIRNYMRDFESALKADDFKNDKGKRYNEYTDFISFVDFFIINEFSKNTDGYRLSTFFHKDKDRTNGPGLLTMGPVWDFNFAWYSVDYSGSGDYKNWSYNDPDMEDKDYMPFWWEKLISDTLFMDYLKTRWVNLRKTILSEAYLHTWIDSMATVLEEPQKRNFKLWDILGENVWSQPEPIPTTYAGEIAAVKKWITDRGKWLDKNMPGNITAIGGKQKSISPKKLVVNSGEKVMIQIYNCLGRRVSSLSFRSPSTIGATALVQSMKVLPKHFVKGLYFYILTLKNGEKVRGKICNSFVWK